MGFVLLAALVQPIAQASRWDVRQEMREGAREVRQEKREARRELRYHEVTDTPGGFTVPMSALKFNERHEERRPCVEPR